MLQISKWKEERCEQVIGASRGFFVLVAGGQFTSRPGAQLSAGTTNAVRQHSTFWYLTPWNSKRLDCAILTE
jgi:hypothetical protein